MRYTFFAIFVVIIFLIMPMNNVVNAEVIEESRTLYIKATDSIPYSSTLNILNNTTNNRFSNAELLIPDFTSKMGFDGGFSGSFMPPSLFQTNFGESSVQNKNLILANTVEFHQKNLLSGSSESWWRCPYAWNYSITGNRDWGVRLSIYMVDDPRNVNLTFPNSLTTAGAVPNPECFPSLVFQKSFSNVGNTNNSNQTWTYDEVFIPIDDEWNISKPNLLLNHERYWLENTSKERRVRDVDGNNVTSGSWKGDFENYEKIDYSFGWFNVSAPIYPNETYFVIWDINDPTGMGINNACSMWVTATDIGRNSYYRSLFAWDDTGSTFNGTTYEIPIDLDTSVIFRIGLGDGVTGIKLDYNDNSDYQDHTYDILTDPSFEDGDAFSPDYAYDMESSEGWTTGHYGVDWGSSNVGGGYGELYMNWESPSSSHGISSDWGVDNLDYQYLEQSWGFTYTEGATIKIKMSFGDLNESYQSPRGQVFDNSVLGLWFQDTLGATPTFDYFIGITRRGYVSDTDGKTYYENQIHTFDSNSTQGFDTVNYNTNNIPKDCYISLTLGEDPTGTATYMSYTLRIYNQLYPFEPTLTYRFSLNRKNTIGNTYLRICGALNGQITSPDYTSTTPVFPEEPRVKVDKVTICERKLNSAWVISDTSLDVHPSFPYTAFEISTPKYDPIYPNKNILEIDDTKFTTASHSITISQEVAYSVSGYRRFYAQGFYQLRNDWIKIINNFHATIQFGVSNNGGTSWTYSTVSGMLVDGSWHQMTSNFVNINNANRFKIGLTTVFPERTLIDLLSGIGNMAFWDNITIGSIAYSTNLFKYEFYQEIDHKEFNSTNFYSLMIPFRHKVDPDFCPIAEITWYDSSDIQVGSIIETNVGNWYDDFIMKSIKTTQVPSNAEYCKIELTNYGKESYLFLQDRNSDGYTNSRDNFKYNYLRKFHESNPSVSYLETWFSPYYSFKITEGEWVNADGSFNTVYFYYVAVRFVAFNDSDPEIIDIKFYDVEVQDFTAFKIQLSSFGAVYSDKEWLAYLEVRQRVSETVSDRVWDALANFWEWLATSPLGSFLANTIGKFIATVIDFVVPALEWSINLFIQVFLIFVAIAIYFITTFMFWKLVNFFIMLSNGRAVEGIEMLNVTTTSIISTASGIGKGIGKAGSGIMGVFK